MSRITINDDKEGKKYLRNTECQNTMDKTKNEIEEYIKCYEQNLFLFLVTMSKKIINVELEKKMIL
jgi:hypothetical protein